MEFPEVPHSLFTNSWLQLVSQIYDTFCRTGCDVVLSSAGGKALYFKVNFVSEAYGTGTEHQLDTKVYVG